MGDAVTAVHEPPVDWSDIESGQEQPHNDRAERAVLGAMLQSEQAVVEVMDILEPLDYYRPAHAAIHRVIVELYAAGKPAGDWMLVLQEILTRGITRQIPGDPAGYLGNLVATVPAVANASHYARIVEARARDRDLIIAGTRIIELGRGEADPDQAKGPQATAILDQAVAGRDNDRGPVAIGDCLDGVLRRIESGTTAGLSTGIADLDRLTNGMSPGMWVIGGRPSMGKALALDTTLPTPTGWTTMGTVQVGDSLIGPDGSPTKVVAATAVMVGRPCFEVQFSDGERIVADAEHEWLTTTRADRRSNKLAGSVKTTREIAVTLRCTTADQRLNHAVPVTAPIDLPEADLPLPPYVLGVWLGDGDSIHAGFTTADPEICTNIEADGIGTKACKSPLRFGLVAPRKVDNTRMCAVCGAAFVPKREEVVTCGRTCGGKVTTLAVRPIAPKMYRPQRDSVTAILRRLGVLGNKHIPTSYLRASEGQRRQLLAGLLDTDGSVANGGTSVRFEVTSKALADGAYELITSLGYRCSMSTRRVPGRTEESSTCYRLMFSPQDKVFRLTRKLALQTVSESHRASVRMITDVRPIPSVPVRCVQVDNNDHMYLAGRGCIPTHNSVLLVDMARSVAFRQGQPALLFSLEMSRDQILMRILAAEARIPLHRLKQGGDAVSDEEWSRIIQAQALLAEAPLMIDDTSLLTVADIAARTRRRAAKGALAFVGVDYLQLMGSTGTGRDDSREREVARISRGLKILSGDLGITVAVAAQLNRGPEQRVDKKPAMSDLRESGAIEADADIVILLHRPDYYDRESERAGEADLHVAKNRDGAQDTVTVAAQLHFSRFADMAVV